MRLLLGIPYLGNRYFDVEVRLLTLGGECAALDTVAELGLAEKETLNTAERMLVDLAYLCEQIEVKGIAKAKITPEFLLDNLATDDYTLINEAIVELRKKHIDAGESLHNPETE
ncbi:hypothetical protein [Rodentibacter pneumotropicus]|uniref:Mu-like prophage FluMu protein gp41 n=1 Tax=Rodentibacter pneumotropicus TaxID=758 RepID=A0A4S2Q1Z7_9PAST|nr:hypothetical protein [Rodentibacter pneumotropicus]THA10501.1 hypothetical protein D3M78_03085 [Rodentibacter pneumotropicus]